MSSLKKKVEYGDFQTPFELALQICQKLATLGWKPDVIIEPTCGVGAFIEAGLQIFPSAKKIFGFEINPAYLEVIQSKIPSDSIPQQIFLKKENFFEWNAIEFIEKLEENILILGNFPWVTNAQQGSLGSLNLPEKINSENYAGLAALTGKSNFDISEWMLRQVATWFRHKPGYLAMLCKTSVARKFLHYLYLNQYSLKTAHLYGIDAKKSFNVAVEAGLLVCHFDLKTPFSGYQIFENLQASNFQQVQYWHGLTIKNWDLFKPLRAFYHKEAQQWRSGIKHDCASVLELKRQAPDQYQNREGTLIEIEATWVFPLLKGSDIANHRFKTTEYHLLITQIAMGETTEKIAQNAPKTWQYLEQHQAYFERRQSKIYRKSDRFAIFGVGSYSFLPWKIAICALYKKLSFCLVGPIEGKPVLFDDTVYFLAFEEHHEAQRTLELLESSEAQDFFSALIFWDEKRPIKTEILNSLDLKKLSDYLEQKSEKPTLAQPFTAPFFSQLELF